MAITKALTPYLGESLSKGLNTIVRKRGWWFIVLVFASMLYLLYSIFRKSSPEPWDPSTSNIPSFYESFTQQEKYVMKQGDDVYDDFYAEIYDDLMFDTGRISYEVSETLHSTGLDDKLEEGAPVKHLDIGCGTGHHVKAFSEAGCKSVGVDKSSSMVKRCKAYYKTDAPKVVQGDTSNTMSFAENSFDLITCYYFTLYQIKDKQQFFNNCFKWLKPGGCLAVHTVNRDKFNPIVNTGDPLVAVNTQKYAKQRITESSVKFTDFQYNANFKLDTDNDRATFEEKMIDDATKHIRVNKHILYMPTQKSIIDDAKSCGFAVKGFIDMVRCQYDNQYIYILQKQ